MSLALDDMTSSCLLTDGEAGADEQLRLAGQLGKALLEDNEELRREIRQLRDMVADSHQVGRSALAGAPDTNRLVCARQFMCMHGARCSTPLAHALWSTASRSFATTFGAPTAWSWRMCAVLSNQNRLSCRKS